MGRSSTKRGAAGAGERGASSAEALGTNSYGKSRVRMVKVSRDGARHTVREICVDVALEGDFEAIHTLGDNRKCLPTDTMKNTVYALGKDHPLETIESFAADLCEHFVSTNPHVTRARVRIAQTPWKRAKVAGRDHPHCFILGSHERQVCEVSRGRGARNGAVVRAGVDELVLLKSTDSGFSGFRKDRLTTLPEVDDRILATAVTATWEYGASGRRGTDFAGWREAVRTALIEAFATHKSLSVQHTLLAMGRAALRACPAAARIRLTLPNRHCLLVNLQPFGLSNRNEVFVPTDEPHGLIEATVERSRRRAPS